MSMKLKLNQNRQSRLELRDGVLCVVVKTPLRTASRALLPPTCSNGSGSRSPTPAWQRSPGDRYATSILRRDYSSTRRNGYRLAGGGDAKPLHAEVIPAEVGPGTPLKAGTNGAPMTAKQRGSNGSLRGRRRRASPGERWRYCG